MLDWPTAGVVIASIAAVCGIVYPFLPKRGGGGDRSSSGHKPHECVKQEQHAELATRVTRLEAHSDHTVPTRLAVLETSVQSIKSDMARLVHGFDGLRETVVKYFTDKSEE